MSASPQNASLEVTALRVSSQLDSPKHTSRSSAQYPKFPPEAEVEPLKKRLWTVWPGNNRFWGDGRVMLGPRGDVVWCAAAGSVLTIVSVAYFVLVAPFLWAEVSPLLPILSACLQLQACIVLLFVVLTEPGIIPRRAVFELSFSVPAQFTSRVLSLREDGSAYKYCNICHIFRPPGSSHCPYTPHSLCDNCVLGFDHHCRYLNSCIGVRNYRYFLLLVALVAVLGLVDIAGLVVMLLADVDDAGEYNGGSGYAVIENDTAVLAIVGVATAVVAVLTAFVVSLCVMHTYQQCSKCPSPSKAPRCTQQPSLFNPRQLLSDQQLAEFAISCSARSANVA